MISKNDLKSHYDAEFKFSFRIVCTLIPGASLGFQRNQGKNTKFSPVVKRYFL